jgi:cobalt/nickel transport system permease protein
MHIPDGFLDARTSVAGMALSTAGVAAALRGVQRTMRPSGIPMMGMTAAFVFAAQMINFPVAAGTSGHLIGATLAAVLLGPWAAIVVMTAVLVVQCLLFADGGLLALGANVFNMAILGAGGGYLLYALFRRIMPGLAGRYAATAIAAWGSTVIASAACAGELAWSGLAPWDAVFAAMVNVHIVIGIGEAVITVLVLSALRSVRPELVEGKGMESPGAARSLMLGGIAACGILLFVAPFASTRPDGLEWVAAQLGFHRAALPAPIVSVPFPAYGIPALGESKAAPLVAGGIGIVVLLAAAYGIARFAMRRRMISGEGQAE